MFEFSELLCWVIVVVFSLAALIRFVAGKRVDLGLFSKPADRAWRDKAKPGDKAWFLDLSGFAVTATITSLYPGANGLVATLEQTGRRGSASYEVDLLKLHLVTPEITERLRSYRFAQDLKRFRTTFRA